ncbi:MAG: GFA family protein [Silicimonas sp.]|nr:GFA family protein [Silicimonas sp.]
MKGRCACGDVQYEMRDRPLFVHCCHCTWCQRETGSAFALNAMIESDVVVVTSGLPEIVETPSASGNGQRIRRCPACRVALWSTYSGEAIAFVRVGTLVDPGACPPDIHIFTSTKLPWVVLGDGVPVMPEYYRRSAHWPEASIRRREAALRNGR